MEGAEEETRLLRAMLARQRQIVESKQKDLDLLEQKIQETLRYHDEVYLTLFPPVRPDRNAAYISSLIEEKCAELTQLQNAISAQETKSDARESSDSGHPPEDDKHLTQLKGQCATTHANLEHLRSLLCPIRVLPVELLIEIFILSSDPMGGASLSNATLVVTHVCSSWRNIAIHRHELWSSLKFGPEHFATKPHGVIPLAQLWLERSGDRPLRLSVRPDARPKNSPDLNLTGLFLQLVRLYAPHFARWKDFFFNYPYFAGRHELFSDIPQNASLPYLERFGIMASNLTFADWFKLSKLLAQAPRLQRLTWMATSRDRDPPFMYNQLTQLEVGGDYSLRKTLAILSHAKCLRILDITVFIKSRSSTTNVAHVVNESLQKFTLTYAGDTSVLFNTLTLPAIQHFHITKTYSLETIEPSKWSQGSFVQFLRRSKSHLTSLGIIDYDISSDDVLVLLHHLSPSLTTFEIESYGLRFITDEVLTALVYPSEAPLAAKSPDTNDPPTILCPLLCDLRIVGCLSSTDGVLARMVESRWRPPPGLAMLGTGIFGLDPTKSSQDKARILALNGTKADYMVLDEIIL